MNCDAARRSAMLQILPATRRPVLKVSVIVVCGRPATSCPRTGVRARVVQITMNHVRLMTWCARSISGIHLAAFAASEGGLFAENGLEVEYVPSSGACE